MFDAEGIACDEEGNSCNAYYGVTFGVVKRPTREAIEESVANVEANGVEHLPGVKLTPLTFAEVIEKGYDCDEAE